VDVDILFLIRSSGACAESRLRNSNLADMHRFQCSTMQAPKPVMRESNRKLLKENSFVGSYGHKPSQKAYTRRSNNSNTGARTFVGTAQVLG